MAYVIIQAQNPDIVVLPLAADIHCIFIKNLVSQFALEKRNLAKLKVTVGQIKFVVGPRTPLEVPIDGTIPGTAEIAAENWNVLPADGVIELIFHNGECCILAKGVAAGATFQIMCQ